MQLSSKLPLAMTFFKHWHTNDKEIGVVVVKAKFQRSANGQFRAVAADPLVLEDVFEGDAGSTVLVHEQEIAPGKTGTDLVIDAVARSPGGRPLRDWAVRVDIEGRLSYGFHVRGPSWWQRVANRWLLTDPEPVVGVPISYAAAFGGGSPDDAGKPVFYEANPAGRGFATPARLSHGEPFPAPQIGSLAEFLAMDARAQMTVHGFGPVAKAWLPRRRLAGTFDETWRRERHPRMPRDYSLQFWNCAPHPLQLSPALRGNEDIFVQGISARPEPTWIRLPGVGMVLSVDGSQGPPLTLDTVRIDVRSDLPEQHSLSLIWRGLVEDHHSITSGQVRHFLIEA